MVKLLNPAGSGESGHQVVVCSKSDETMKHADQGSAVLRDQVSRQESDPVAEIEPTERDATPMTRQKVDEGSCVVLLAEILNSLDEESNGFDFLSSDSSELCGGYAADIAQLADISHNFRNREAFSSLVKQLKKESTEGESAYLELLKDASLEKIRYYNIVYLGL